MSQLTYFTLSIKKGLRGNIGKLPVFKQSVDGPYADLMVFLVPNTSSSEKDSTQIVNVHFPPVLFETLRGFSIGDYVRIYFDRIDLVKGIHKKTGKKELLYTIAKANNITLLRKVVREEVFSCLMKPEIEEKVVESQDNA